MALIEILRSVHIVLNDNGTVRAVRGEYDEKDDATGRIVPKGTARIRPHDLATELPTQAAWIAAVDAANAERDAAIAERDAALAATPPAA